MWILGCFFLFVYVIFYIIFYELQLPVASEAKKRRAPKGNMTVQVILPN